MGEYDGGDKEQVKAKEQKSASRQKRIANGLKLVLSQADSRLWLYDLLEEAGPFKEPFTGNSHTFYNAGKQAWAKLLTQTMLSEHIEDYTRMMKENTGQN